MRRLLSAFAAAALLFRPLAVSAEPGAASEVGACIMAAADAYRLPPAVLVILLNVENGRLGKVSQNANKTVDIGPMQVNDTWVRKIALHWRSSESAAYAALRHSFCANVEGGAWILRQAVDEANGDFWEGVALYHSHTERHKVEYLTQVLAHTMRLKKQAAAEMAQAETDDGRRQ
jgi:hypothetical protein